MSLGPCVRLGDLVDLKVGFASGKDLPEGVLQVRMNNVSASGHLDFSSQRRVPVPAGKLHDLEALPGDVLFNATNAPGLVGKTATFLGMDEPVVFSNHFYRLRPHADLDGRYLGRLLAWHYTRGTFRLMCRQWVNQASINRDQLMDLEIPLPSLGEQRRIAGILDAADGLRAKRRESIALLDTLTQSIFLDMFGDPSANDQGWTLTPLKEVLCGIDSGRSPVCLDREANDGEWGVLKLGAVSSGRYIDAQNKALPLDVEPHTANEVREGDVLFSRKNTPQLVAKTAWVRATKPRMLLPDLIFRLVPGDALDPGYLSAVLTNPRLNARVRSLATGSAASMVNISKSKLLDFRIPVPPLYLQRRFAATTERVEGSRSLAQAYSSEMDSFFSSLQARAFRGQL